MALRRDDWLDLARKVDWTYTYADERELFPPEMSGEPWLPHRPAWADWSESYRTTYREYVRNQASKDLGVRAVRDALNKPRVNQALDPGWLQLVKFHHGIFAEAEYAAVPAELRMARFGRDSAWRIMATFGALDEVRHGQIPLLLGHDLLDVDANFDWTHKAFHTNNWLVIAARHYFDDSFVAADAIEMAVQLNFVLETGFTNLQFMALAAMADQADHHLFEKALLSIQTDEARHAQIGHPVLRTLINNGGKDYAQYLVDKAWWRSWRAFIATSGTAMDYLTPLAARTKSFKEFVHEWLIEQFVRNLEEFDLGLPWFWPLFVDEVDYAHHSLQLLLYSYRTLLWFDEPSPSAQSGHGCKASIPTGSRPTGRSGMGSRLDGGSKVSRPALPTRCHRSVTSASWRQSSSAPATTQLHSDSRWSPLPVLLRAVPLDLPNKIWPGSPSTRRSSTACSTVKRRATRSTFTTGWVSIQPRAWAATFAAGSTAGGSNRCRECEGRPDAH